MEVAIITDLDGTLLNQDRNLSPIDRKTLEELGKQGILRVVATGRSLHSAHKVLTQDMPIDYLIFSSGAGILEWKNQTLVQKLGFDIQAIEEIQPILLEMNLDFMLHAAVPENHHFYYHQTSRVSPDFLRRLELYRNFAEPLDRHDLNEASQFIAICGTVEEGLRATEALREKLPHYKIIRATSPLDHQSFWIEIFPKTVSKALAAQALFSNRKLSLRTIGIGNDYNDYDLLEWTNRSYVMGNSPADLRNKYLSVSTNDEDGFSEAVQLGLEFFRIPFNAVK